MVSTQSTVTFDPIHYYAFVLDALARYGHQGTSLSAHRILPFMRKHKPVTKLMKNTAKRMLQLDLRKTPGDILEFGVYKGTSLRLLARLFPECKLYGFDTFSGFPDDGRKDWQLDFSTSTLPPMPPRVELIVGRFEDTLATFLRQYPQAPFRLIHIDCDIFSATNYVLSHLMQYLDCGSVIIFDELCNYAEFLENELLALYLFLQERKLDFEWFVTIGDIYSIEMHCAGIQPPNAFIGYRNICCYQNTSILLTPDLDRGARIARFMDDAKRLHALRPMQQPFPPALN